MTMIINMTKNTSMTKVNEILIQIFIEQATLHYIDENNSYNLR